LKIKDFIRDFSPWIIFQFVVGFNLFDVEKAAIISLLAVLIFCFEGIKKYFILDWGTLLFFVLLSFGKFLPFYSWIETHPTLTSNGALSLIIWCSILLQKPFTLQYAKEKVDAATAKHPQFIRMNYILSFVWAGTLTAMTIFSFYSDYFAKNSLVMNDILPITLIILAIHFTKWFPQYYKRKHQK